MTCVAWGLDHQLDDSLSKNSQPASYTQPRRLPSIYTGKPADNVVCQEYMYPRQLHGSM